MKILSKNLPLVVVLTCILISVTQVKAQKVEVSPFIGYETGAKAMTNLGKLHISDGLCLGTSVDIGLGGGRYAEISVSHLGSYLNLDQEMVDNRICDLSVNYFSLGVLQEIKADATTTPFGLLTLGIVNYHPSTGDYSSESRMHMSLGGVLKVRASSRIGLRFQARLLLPFYRTDNYFTVGTEGSGYSIEGGFRAVQADLTGAVIIFLN